MPGAAQDRNQRPSVVSLGWKQVPQRVALLEALEAHKGTSLANGAPYRLVSAACMGSKSC